MSLLYEDGLLGAKSNDSVPMGNGNLRYTIIANSDPQPSSPLANLHQLQRPHTNRP
jgi:hypothetical protein